MDCAPRHAPAVSLLIVVLILTLPGCKPSVGGQYVGPMRNPIVSLPSNARGGAAASFFVSWGGGIAPYLVHYEFSGCVNPLEYAQQAGATEHTLSVTFEPTTSTQNCTVTVTVTDAAGLSVKVPARGFAVAPGGGAGPGPDPDPDPGEIVLTLEPNDAACLIEVTAADPDGNDLTITATPPQGMNVVEAVQVLEGGNGTLVFHFAPEDIFAGATGTVNFRAEKNGVVVAEDSVLLNCSVGSIVPDTIYAIPASGAVAVGQPVRIIVATTATASPFHHLGGVRVTFPSASGALYVAESFDTGAFDDDGHRATPIDGIWADVGATGFLLPSDGVIRNPVNPGGGRIGYDFRITPVGGSVVQTSGILFSFEVTFSHPGSWDIGFQRTSPGDNIHRTFYRETTTGPPLFWGDDDNVHSAPNSVEVSP